MRTIARHAGPFFFVSYLLATLVAGGVSYLERRGIEDAITPLIFYPLGVAGAIFLMMSFFGGSRDRSGDRPRFGMLAFFWLFFGVFMVLSSTFYLRFELAYADLLPRIPDWLLFGFRNAAFVLIFEVGWGVYFGTKRGWLNDETSPWPLGWMFRRASPPVEMGDGDDSDNDSSGNDKG